MNDTKLKLEQIEPFLTASQSITFTPLSKEACYAEIARKLKQWRYFKLSKKKKMEVREYLQKRTGYSHSQLTRLIAQYKQKKWIGKRAYQRHRFSARYTREDILLLARTDECHQTLSGAATKKLLERAHYVFNDAAYERLSTISVAHIYNLRKSRLYQEKRRHFTATVRSAVPIGERRKPAPNGQPGYLRIDTVHQGDQDGIKGVYHINAVDEVTQMEMVFAVEKISENCLIPVLEMLIETFPFHIKNIHADNGSEYINYRVAQLLQKLLIDLTKSRARHSNDNALAECKNGAIVRKWLGYQHIPQRFAPALNQFYRDYLNPYINYHRPCFFPVIEMDKRGKEKKRYPYEAMMTPFEKFCSLPDAQHYLKPTVSLTLLKAQAQQVTDLTAAEQLQLARQKLFSHIFKKNA
jgi:transposase InsO family protein